MRLFFLYCFAGGAIGVLLPRTSPESSSGYSTRSSSPDPPRTYVAPPRQVIPSLSRGPMSLPPKYRRHSITPLRRPQIGAQREVTQAPVLVKAKMKMQGPGTMDIMDRRFRDRVVVAPGNIGHGKIAEAGCVAVTGAICGGHILASGKGDSVVVNLQTGPHGSAWVKDRNSDVSYKEDSLRTQILGPDASLSKQFRGKEGEGFARVDIGVVLEGKGQVIASKKVRPRGA